MAGSDLLRRSFTGGMAAAFALGLASLTPGPADAQVTAFKQAVAEAAARDADIAAFYREAGYAPIWTGNDGDDRKRLREFMSAVDLADEHGLPAGRYSPQTIEAALRSVRTERDRGRVEVELSRMFVQYARDIQTGVLVPSSIDEDIKREVPLRSRSGLLRAFSKSSPKAFLRALPPQSQEYARLMKEKMRFERLLGQGGWGEIVRAGRTLRPGDAGNDVIALRNRLIRMGYLPRTATASYDGAMLEAVQRFQIDHGLTTDGVAGPGTLEAINMQVEDRLGQIIVAMERERWINRPDGLGKRHIWVNLTDFRAKIIDDGKVTFSTKAVVGERLLDKRTPEFSDVMEYMELNPDWTVPRSILGRDYLPRLQEDPYAARYLQLIDARGRVVNRDEIDFTQYTERNFPFTVRQPPGDLNALGLVKFMFPNPHAIYLHDTPAKNLFQREVRAYSSGCIRLNEPFDFAYALLARQMSNPKQVFDAELSTGRQSRINLAEPVPVHLVYRTAFTTAKGGVEFRRDFYGRDAKVWAGLRNAGVALRAVRG